MNKIDFLEKKKYENYYKGHYLESVARLFPKIFGYKKAESLLRASKGIKNQRERKKLLKSIYHIEKNKKKPTSMIEMISCDERDYINHYENILKNYKTNSRILSYFSERNNLKSFSFKEFLEKSETKAQFFKKREVYRNEYIELKKINYDEKIVKIKIKNNEIKVDDTKYKIKGLETRKELKDKAVLYNCCWNTTYETFPYIGFLDILDEKEQHIGTIRYITENTRLNTASMAVWLNPKLVDNKYYIELNKSALEKLAKAMDEIIDKNFLKSENLKFMPHYQNEATQHSKLPRYEEEKKKNKLKSRP